MDDPYEFVFAEAVRASLRLQDALESLRVRAGVVLSGAAVASSLFGSQALAGGRLGAFGAIALISFAGLGLALVLLLWPRPEWKDTANPSLVIEYERLASYFRLAAILLNIEVLAWIGDLLTKA